MTSEERQCMKGEGFSSATRRGFDQQMTLTKMPIGADQNCRAFWAVPENITRSKPDDKRTSRANKPTVKS
jgi:hypothetical protein